MLTPGQGLSIWDPLRHGRLNEQDARRIGHVAAGASGDATLPSPENELRGPHGDPFAMNENRR